MATMTIESGRLAVGAVLLPLMPAADYLTVSSRTLKALVSSGAIPVVRVSARRIAFLITDLDSYIASRRAAN